MCQVFTVGSELNSISLKRRCWLLLCHRFATREEERRLEVTERLSMILSMISWGSESMMRVDWRSLGIGRKQTDGQSPRNDFVGCRERPTLMASVGPSFPLTSVSRVRWSKQFGSKILPGIRVLIQMSLHLITPLKIHARQPPDRLFQH